MKKMDSEKIKTYFCLAILIGTVLVAVYILDIGPAVQPPAAFTYADVSRESDPAGSEPAVTSEPPVFSEPPDKPAAEKPVPSRPAPLPPAESEKQYLSSVPPAASSAPVSSREEVSSEEPSEPEEPDAPSVPEEPPAPSVVNLNTATEAELCTLDGIGPVLAARIIEFREACGGFSSIEELMDVSGIGEKKLAAIRDRITV